ncbi:MAG TPA: hypothetical protein VIX63_09875 [Vicinamibacterales bacterium]
MSTTIAPDESAAVRSGLATPAKDAVASAGSAASAVASYPSLSAAYAGPRWKWNSLEGSVATRA